MGRFLKNGVSVGREDRVDGGAVVKFGRCFQVRPDPVTGIGDGKLTGSAEDHRRPISRVERGDDLSRRKLTLLQF